MEHIMSAQQKQQPVHPKQKNIQKVMKSIRAQVQQQGSVYLKNAEVPFGGE